MLIVVGVMTQGKYATVGQVGQVVTVYGNVEYVGRSRDSGYSTVKRASGHKEGKQQTKMPTWEVRAEALSMLYMQCIETAVIETQP
eukprot:13978-Heterococcus_DN1.PRE.3